jgi:hypothetical protein
MFDAGSNTWLLSAGVHYVLNSDEIAASTDTLDSGAQDSAGIPMVPLLVRYSEVPLGVQHPLRIDVSVAHQWVCVAGHGVLRGSGPPQGSALPAESQRELAGDLSGEQQSAGRDGFAALQQYGAYMSDHGSAGYMGGAPDVRWDDNDLACIKNFHVSDLEVVDNSALEVSAISGQTQPYVVPATLPVGARWGRRTMRRSRRWAGTRRRLRWTVSSGTLPSGLLLDAVAGTITVAHPVRRVRTAWGSPLPTSLQVTPRSRRRFPMAVTGVVPAPDLTIAKTHTGHLRARTDGRHVCHHGEQRRHATGQRDGDGDGDAARGVDPGIDGRAPGGLVRPRAASCTRADALAAGASYPAITVTGERGGECARQRNQHGDGVGRGRDEHRQRHRQRVLRACCKITARQRPRGHAISELQHDSDGGRRANRPTPGRWCRPPAPVFPRE